MSAGSAPRFSEQLRTFSHMTNSHLAYRWGPMFTDFVLVSAKLRAEGKNPTCSYPKNVSGEHQAEELWQRSMISHGPLHPEPPKFEDASRPQDPNAIKRPALDKCTDFELDVCAFTGIQPDESQPGGIQPEGIQPGGSAEYFHNRDLKEALDDLCEICDLRPHIKFKCGARRTRFRVDIVAKLRDGEKPAGAPSEELVRAVQAAFPDTADFREYMGVRRFGTTKYRFSITVPDVIVDAAGQPIEVGFPGTANWLQSIQRRLRPAGCIAGPSNSVNGAGEIAAKLSMASIDDEDEDELFGDEKNCLLADEEDEEDEKGDMFARRKVAIFVALPPRRPT